MKLAVRSEDEAVSDAIHDIVASSQVFNSFVLASNPASIYLYEIGSRWLQKPDKFVERIAEPSYYLIFQFSYTKFLDGIKYRIRQALLGFIEQVDCTLSLRRLKEKRKIRYPQ